jgi:phospholipid/cholesterol/gamma-HCH transport system ATP-binding protein
MQSDQPILELSQVKASAAQDEIHGAPIDLKLFPGELAMVAVREWKRAVWLGDLCCGLLPLKEGSLRFLGHDWSDLHSDYASALRGRIGRVASAGGWISWHDLATNIILPQLHHTRRPESLLLDEATKLATAFGLPGIPLGRIEDTSTLDLARGACVRALLGKPVLLILEDPLRGHATDLLQPLLNEIAMARAEGRAILWFAEESFVWRDRSINADRKFLLNYRGLWPARRAA